MTKSNLRDCRHGKDFLAIVQSSEHQTVKPVEVKFGKGDHVKVSTPKGTAVFPVGHELGIGLRSKVVKQLMAIGISCFALFVLVSQVL